MRRLRAAAKKEKEVTYPFPPNTSDADKIKILDQMTGRFGNEWARACNDRDRAENKVAELTAQLVNRDAQKTITALEAQVASLQSALDHCRAKQPQFLDQLRNKHMANRVDDLDLSVRAANCLQAMQIATISELTVFSEAELLKGNRYISKKVVKEIRTKLGKLGLRLKGDK